MLTFNFKTHKLINYRTKKRELETSNNPFAIVVLVHLIFLETKKDPKARFIMKLRLTQLLYERGYGRDYVINLLKVIDWALVIPKDLELEYKEKLHELEEEKNMSYITSFERLSREEGLQQGLQKGRQEGLEQGREEERYEMAKNLLAEGLPLELVKKVTKLPDLVLTELEDA
ncbi:hypothetical protein [Rickettsiella grylli]|uniref:Transposase n=1 Tax=Rickettsiella grylli TaxID=59196 RepID=A8PKB8_9COXI|nr:hypothetical protein [Rickettsiella grylli]EDP46570.1 conserved hypothetical protein [Rickettsiella grylli]